MELNWWEALMGVIFFAFCSGPPLKEGGNYLGNEDRLLVRNFGIDTDCAMELAAIRIVSFSIEERALFEA